MSNEYILLRDPESGALGEAFEALDRAFGTESFSKGQAQTVLYNELGSTDVEATLAKLSRGEYIGEVDAETV